MTLLFASIVVFIHFIFVWFTLHNYYVKEGSKK